MANEQGWSGNRRWREWLHRATHHSADDDRQLVQADEQARRGDEEHPGAGGAKSHASLDQVLRRAAAERASQRDAEA